MNAASTRAIFKIAFTFAGTLIGAGFASGQELLQFFITYGSFGFAGILFAGLLFAWLSYRLLSLSYRFQFRSYTELIRFLCGKKIGACFECAVFLFLFTVLVVMLAAAGSVAETLFSLPALFGRGLLSLAVLGAAARGVHGIAKINFCATPFLVAVITLVSLSSLQHHDFSAELFFAAAQYAQQPAPHWLLSCALYVGYNLVLGIAVLVPLGRETPSAAGRKYGSLLGGMLLASLSFLIVGTLLIHSPALLAEPIPMLTVSCSQNDLHAFLYATAFILALFTTSSSCLYGCAAKLSTTVPLPLSLPLITLAALACSGIGFERLIALAFPIFGYASLWLLIRLAVKDGR